MISTSLRGSSVKAPENQMDFSYSESMRMNSLLTIDQKHFCIIVLLGNGLPCRFRRIFWLCFRASRHIFDLNYFNSVQKEWITRYNVWFVSCCFGGSITVRFSFKCQIVRNDRLNLATFEDVMNGTFAEVFRINYEQTIFIEHKSGATSHLIWPNQVLTPVFILFDSCPSRTKAKL